MSLIPTLAKVFEKLVVKEGIVDCLLSLNLLSDNLVNDAMFSFLNEVYTELNEEETSAVIFCDLSKAFVYIQQRMSFHNLEHSSFRCITLKWFYISCK